MSVGRAKRELLAFVIIYHTLMLSHFAMGKL